MRIEGPTPPFPTEMGPSAPKSPTLQAVQYSVLVDLIAVQKNVLSFPPEQSALEAPPVTAVAAVAAPTAQKTEIEYDMQAWGDLIQIYYAQKAGKSADKWIQDLRGILDNCSGSFQSVKTIDLTDNGKVLTWLKANVDPDWLNQNKDAIRLILENKDSTKDPEAFKAASNMGMNLVWFLTFGASSDSIYSDKFINIWNSPGGGSENLAIPKLAWFVLSHYFTTDKDHIKDDVTFFLSVLSLPELNKAPLIELKTQLNMLWGQGAYSLANLKTWPTIWKNKPEDLISAELTLFDKYFRGLGQKIK